MFAHVNDGVERPKVARNTAFRNPGFPAISAEASSVRMQGSTKTYSKDSRLLCKQTSLREATAMT